MCLSIRSFRQGDHDVERLSTFVCLFVLFASNRRLGYRHGNNRILLLLPEAGGITKHSNVTLAIKKINIDNSTSYLAVYNVN